MKSSKKKVKEPSKLQVIRSLKQLLSEVNVTDLAKRLGWSRQNIYKHLDESKADSASAPHLTMISDAIKAEKKEQAAKLSRII